MKELQNKHRTIARYLAMGISLREICLTYNLNYETWKDITASPLFKHEMNRLHNELEDRMLDEAAKDPVVAQLKLSSLKAVNRLVQEIDNEGEDSSASTRIKAAESILDRCGYFHKEEAKESNIIFVSLSPDKLEAALGKKTIAEQPKSISGNP